MITRATTETGIRLLADHRPGTGTVAFRMVVGAGARNDPPGRAGLTHFLEHMVLRSNGRSAEVEFEATGGKFNAGVTRDYTMFEAVMPADTWERGLTLLSTVFGPLSWPEPTLERERAVIYREIMQSYDTSQALWDAFYAALWPGDGLGRPIAGTLDSVAAITPDELLNHYSLYRTGNVCLGVSGDVDPALVTEAAGRLFTGLAVDARGPVPPASPPLADRPLPVVIPRDVRMSTLIIGFPAPAMGDQGRYAARMLNIILGQTAHSRLYRRLRADTGSVYRVQSVWMGLCDAGLLAIACTVEPERIVEVVASLRSELYGLDPTPREHEWSQSFYRGSLAVNFETNKSRAGIMGIEELLGEAHVPLPDAIRRIEAVTREDLQSAAASILHPGREQIVTCAPSEMCERLQSELHGNCE